MSESFIQLPSDGTGKKLRSILRADKHEEVLVPLSLDGTIDLKALNDLVDKLTKALVSIGSDTLRVKSV